MWVVAGVELERALGIVGVTVKGYVRDSSGEVHTLADMVACQARS